MSDKQKMKTTVSSNEQFFEQLEEKYPAANSLSQALLMAAQDGVDFKTAVSKDLQSYIRETTRDEAHDVLLECGFDPDDLGDTD